MTFDLYGIFNYDSQFLMPNARQKNYQKREYARSILFGTQTENLNRKFFSVQYVKKVNFKQLITFNI